MENEQNNPQVNPAKSNRASKKLVVVIVVLAVVVALALAIAALAFSFGRLSLGSSEAERAAIEAQFTNNEPCGDYPFTSLRKVVYADIDNLYAHELRIMRNEIYARHGYIFDSDDMRRYFSSKEWYRPISKDVVLSEIEKFNVDYLKEIEDVHRAALAGADVGDWEWGDTSCEKLTYRDLGRYGLEDLRLMRNWLYARHGYIFDSEDMREFFSGCFWYRPVTKNVELTEIEKHNVELIKRYEREHFRDAN